MSLLQLLARGARAPRSRNFRKPCACGAMGSWTDLAPRYENSLLAPPRLRPQRRQSTLSSRDRRQRRIHLSELRPHVACRLSSTDRYQRWFTRSEDSQKALLSTDSFAGDRDDDNEEDPLPFLGTSDDPGSLPAIDFDDDDDALECQNSLPENPPGEGLVLKNSPLYYLNAHYKSQHGLSSVASYIGAEFDRVAENSVSWSAVFTCPVSGTQHPSGTLRSEDPQSVSTLYSNDGRRKISYGKKRTAIKAAAARALDVIQYELLGIVEPRLCHEDPSVPFDLRAQEPASDEPHPPRRTCVEFGHLSSKTESVRESPSSQNDVPIEDMEVLHDDDDDDSLREEAESNDRSEDSMEVVWMPVASRATPPARRILDALSSGVSRSDPPVLENERMPMLLNPIQRLKLAVDRANAWAEAQQRYRHRRSSGSKLRTFVDSADSSEQIILAGKAVLANLAEANQSTPSGSTRYGEEKAASNVLAVLEATARDGAGTLDADIYTSFLLCLEDPYLLWVARKAEVLVSAMRAGGEEDGSVKPKPTIRTINALIQLYAQVGGTTGRYDRLEVDFRPDRGSFLAILSSLIYRPTRAKENRGFDAEFCRQCTKRMVEMAQETGDDTLLPDTQVYNAPLRWYGGNHFRRTRPYARVLRADRFDLRFAGGLLSEEDVSTPNAKAMEAWLDEMNESSDSRIKPDIETYEAIIQGWVRSATRRGLDRAQAIAEGLLSGGGTRPRPRLQTFRPIVIAWALSKDPNSPEKIQTLLDRLKDASETTPELDPDSRMYQYLMASHVHTQETLLRKSSSSSHHSLDSDELESIVSSARACDRILNRLSEQLSTPSESECFIEITPFEYAVLAWRNAALAAVMLVQESEDRQFPASFALAMENMVDVRRRFEGTLQRMKDNEVSEPFVPGNKKSQQLSQQLRHMLRYAHRVHSSLIVSLLEISSKSKESSSESPVNGNCTSILVRYLPEVESMLRTGGECNSFVDLLSLSKFESRLSTLKSNQSDKPSDPVREQIDLPHCHSVAAARLTYPDQMALVDSRLLSGWTYGSFIRYVVDYLWAVMREKGDSESAGLRRGEMVRLLSLLQSYPMSDEESVSSDSSALHESRGAIHQLMNQLSPFQQLGSRPWRQGKTAIAGPRS